MKAIPARILDAIVTKLRPMSLTVNGGRLSVGRPQPGVGTPEADLSAAIKARDPQYETGPQGISQWLMPVDITLESFVSENGNDNAEDRLMSLMGDCAKAICDVPSQAFRLGGLAVDSYVGAMVLEPTDPQQSAAVGTLTINVRFRTNLFDLHTSATS